MFINESTNYYANVTVKDTNGNDVVIANLSGSTDSNRGVYNISSSIVNPELVAANKDAYFSQFNLFTSYIQSKITCLQQ